MGTQDASQCCGCGVVGEGEEDNDDGRFFCYTCWLIHDAAWARLKQNRAPVRPERNFQGVSCAQPEGLVWGS